MPTKSELSKKNLEEICIELVKNGSTFAELRDNLRTGNLGQKHELTRTQYQVLQRKAAAPTPTNSKPLQNTECLKIEIDEEKIDAECKEVIEADFTDRYSSILMRKRLKRYIKLTHIYDTAIDQYTQGLSPFPAQLHSAYIKSYQSFKMML